MGARVVTHGPIGRERVVGPSVLGEPRRRVIIRIVVAVAALKRDPRIRRRRIRRLVLDHVPRPDARGHFAVAVAVIIEAVRSTISRRTRIVAGRAARSTTATVDDLVALPHTARAVLARGAVGVAVALLLRIRHARARGGVAHLVRVTVGVRAALRDLLVLTDTRRRDAAVGRIAVAVVTGLRRTSLAHVVVAGLGAVAEIGIRAVGGRDALDFFVLASRRGNAAVDRETIPVVAGQGLPRLADAIVARLGTVAEILIPAVGVRVALGNRVVLADASRGRAGIDRRGVAVVTGLRRTRTAGAVRAGLGTVAQVVVLAVGVRVALARVEDADALAVAGLVGRAVAVVVALPLLRHTHSRATAVAVATHEVHTIFTILTVLSVLAIDTVLAIGSILSVLTVGPVDTVLAGDHTDPLRVAGLPALALAARGARVEGLSVLPVLAVDAVLSRVALVTFLALLSLVALGADTVLGIALLSAGGHRDHEEEGHEHVDEVLHCQTPAHLRGTLLGYSSSLSHSRTEYRTRICYVPWNRSLVHVQNKLM